jgi:hypothetical protein
MDRKTNILILSEAPCWFALQKRISDEMIPVEQAEPLIQTLDFQGL